MIELVDKIRFRANRAVSNSKDFKRRWQQRIYFLNKVDRNATRLIIFFIEGPLQKGTPEKISGGITSIESIYQRSREFRSIHKAETVLCTLSGYRLFRFTTFQAHSRIIHWDQLISFNSVQEALIHIPEYLTTELLRQLRSGSLLKQLKAKDKQLNILNQNIELMPEAAIVDELKKYFSRVTQTTAHKNYSSDKFLSKYNIPYHFFSARIDIKQYKFVPFVKKEKLILFSPDNKTKNYEVIQLLQKSLTGYRFRTIEDMTYNEYKKQISTARFCFTFGEGLDGYFVEPFFCGTVSFAIYNQQFFRAAYKGLPSVFDTEEDLLSTIIDKIARLLDEAEYNIVVEKTNALLTADYNYRDYVDNIRNFYSIYFKE